MSADAAKTSTPAVTDNWPVMTWLDFLRNQPPGTIAYVTDFATNAMGPDIFQEWKGTLMLPNIQCYCPSEPCSAEMLFESRITEIKLKGGKELQLFIQYQCKHCEDRIKIFAIILRPENDGKLCFAIKIGEMPVDETPTPSKVISLIGPDRDLYLQGRRCLRKGFGVGAFAYFRRVVERQRSRLLAELLKVAQRLAAHEDVIAGLHDAASKTSFDESVKVLRGAWPDVLRIREHNPLTLLHSALSEGIHAQSDAECLESAQSIEVILFELAERLSRAASDQDQLTKALTKLLQKQQKNDTAR